MHKPVTLRSEYRADIDGLRSIAVLSVFLFHLQPHLLPGGFLGVDVFFVISGYLISGIILREHHLRSFSFIHFYARRIKRIFPALFVVLALSAVVALLLLDSQDLCELHAVRPLCGRSTGEFLLFPEGRLFQ